RGVGAPLLEAADRRGRGGERQRSRAKQEGRRRNKTVYVHHRLTGWMPRIAGPHPAFSIFSRIGGTKGYFSLNVRASATCRRGARSPRADTVCRRKSTRM